MNARTTACVLAAFVIVPSLTFAQALAPSPDAQGRPGSAYNLSHGDSQGGSANTMPSSSSPMQAPRMMPRAQRGQLLNVKVEFTITDQVGTKPPVKKTMTMVVADGESSRIRTSVDFRVPVTTKNDKGEVVKTVNRGDAPLSVDVSPTVEGAKIRLDFSVEYSATELQDDGSLGNKTTVSERLAAVLDSGVPLVVAQSSDAYSDRKVTVEIKATILK